jgi:hypothetical protein
MCWVMGGDVLVLMVASETGGVSLKVDGSKP